MKRTSCILLLLAMASLPVSAVAQTDTKEEPKTPAAKDAPKDASKDAPKDAAKDASKDQPADAAKTAPADAKTAPADAKTTPAKTDANGKVVGPGGRELRTDYPGKEEALKSQMETDGLKTNTSAEEKSKVYDTRIQELERKIDDMKQAVFRSKSRIVLLRETLLGNRNAGSKAVLVHHSKINDSYRLKRAFYRMDGTSLINEINSDGSLDKKKIKLYDGSIGPGTHKLVVLLQYSGKSAMFKYFEGYDFELKTSCDFTVKQGQVTSVEVEVFEGGNITTGAEKRPQIRCNVSSSDLNPEEVIKANMKKKDAAKK